MRGVLISKGQEILTVKMNRIIPNIFIPEEPKFVSWEKMGEIPETTDVKVREFAFAKTVNGVHIYLEN